MALKGRLRRGVSLEVIVEEEDGSGHCTRMGADDLREVTSSSDTESDGREDTYDVTSPTPGPGGATPSRGGGRTKERDSRQGTADSSSDWYRTLDHRKGKLSRARSVSCEALTMDASEEGDGPWDEDWGDAEGAAGACIGATSTVSRRRILQRRGGGPGEPTDGGHDDGDDYEDQQDEHHQQDDRQTSNEGDDGKCTPLGNEEDSTSTGSGEQGKVRDDKGSQSSSTSHHAIDHDLNQPRVNADCPVELNGLDEETAVMITDEEEPTDFNGGGSFRPIVAPVDDESSTSFNAGESLDASENIDSTTISGANNPPVTDSRGCNPGDDDSDDGAAGGGEEDKEQAREAISQDDGCEGGEEDTYVHADHINVDSYGPSDSLDADYDIIDNFLHKAIEEQFNSIEKSFEEQLTPEEVQEEAEQVAEIAFQANEIKRLSSFPGGAGTQSLGRELKVFHADIPGKIPLEKRSVNLTKRRRNMQALLAESREALGETPAELKSTSAYDPREVLLNEDIVIVENNPPSPSKEEHQIPALPCPNKEVCPWELPAPHTVSNVRKFFEDPQASLENLYQKRSQGLFRDVRSNPSSKILRFDRNNESDSHSVSAGVCSKYSQTLPRSLPSRGGQGMIASNNLRNLMPPNIAEYDTLNSPFSGVPPHVFRITAEIAEYQERAEDVRKMKALAVKSIDHSKRNIISELSQTLREGDDRQGSNSKEDGGETLYPSEPSQILQNLKLVKRSNQRPRGKVSQPENCSVTPEGKVVQLRKPVLAKGFNVQKALQDNPRYFHITAPEHHSLGRPNQPSSHSGSGGVSSGRRRTHAFSDSTTDRSDLESLSSDTSDDSGVSNDSSASSSPDAIVSSQLPIPDRQHPKHHTRGKLAQAHNPTGRHIGREAGAKGGKSTVVLGCDQKRLGVDEGSNRKDNTLHGPTSRTAHHFADPSFKWIDPEILAKIRSVGTTVIFFGPGSRTKNENLSRHPPQRQIRDRSFSAFPKAALLPGPVDSTRQTTPRKPSNGASGEAESPTDGSMNSFSSWSYSDSPASVYSTIQGLNTHSNCNSSNSGGPDETNKDKGTAGQTSSGGGDIRKQLEQVLKSELRKRSFDEPNLEEEEEEEGSEQTITTQDSFSGSVTVKTVGMGGGRPAFPLPDNLIAVTAGSTRTQDADRRMEKEVIKELKQRQHGSKGLSVTAITVTTQGDHEIREAVMTIGAETDTESGSSSFDMGPILMSADLNNLMKLATARRTNQPWLTRTRSTTRFGEMEPKDHERKPTTIEYLKKLLSKVPTEMGRDSTPRIVGMIRKSRKEVASCTPAS